MILHIDSKWLACGTLALLCGQGALALDTTDTLLLAEPAISRQHLAFVYDGDIWISDRDGGNSRRLTTAEGQEARPHFSPDGNSLVFSANYDGNIDVYLVPVSGGAPKRLTWHGADDLAEGFDAQGRVVFSSQRNVYSRREIHLYTVEPGGSFPVQLPIPLGNDSDVSADNRKIAYSVMPPGMYRAMQQWKDYRGGSVSRVAIMDLDNHSVQKVPQPAQRSNDLNPMWIGDKLYFNSDRDGEFNLYSFDPASAAIRQLTFHKDYPVVNASAGDGKIIYEQGAHLRLFDPANNTDNVLRIATNSDLRETRPRRVSSPEYVRNVAASPNLDQVALEYRGEIVTVPTSKAMYRNLTESPGANDRSPAWSPLGDKIAWFSDGTDEYELYVGNANGTGQPRHIKIDSGSGTYQHLKWSPDARHVSFIDSAYSIFIVDLDSGRTRKVASNEFFGPEVPISHNWSPDSNWLAYTQNTHGLIQTVHLYSLAQNRSQQITDGLAEVSEPVFDPDGKTLYVIASSEAGPVKDWFAQSSLDMTFKHAIYAIVLARNEPSPLPPEYEVSPADRPADSPSEPQDQTAKAAGKSKDKAGKGQQSPAAPITIDFDGLSERIVALPTGGSTLRNLQVGKSGELYYLSTPATPALEALAAPAELKRLVLKERTPQTLLTGVDAYQVSHDGEKLLFHQGQDWKTVATAGEVKAEAATPLAVGEVSILIDPRQEWRQIVREAWRLNRDGFYAPNFHGADWNEVWQRYQPFIDHAATRWDVGRIISAVASELKVGHSFSTPGESIAKPAKVNVGLLGADFAIDNGHYRFTKVYGGVNWRPDVRAPLQAPGISVSDGEYLLAVDGKPLTAAENVYAAFQNRADRPVSIRVGPNADGKGARTLTVTPLASDMELRYAAWVEGNIRKVDAATGGRVAYVHVPDTANDGHAEFKRYFYPQSHKQAIIIDDRNNGGGFIADYYIDILRRQPIINWATRHGKDDRSPRGAIFGPKVMLINEAAGSGGDLLPWMFHKLELGTLVGTRTWGGLVGILDTPMLMDGSSITTPNVASWTTEQGWVVENEGVPPDVEVEETPQTILANKDEQLDKAIEIALQGLAANPPPPAPKHPPYPVRK